MTSGNSMANATAGIHGRAKVVLKHTTMKNPSSYLLVISIGFLSTIAISGCNSPAEQPSVAPQPVTAGKSAPPQAQSLATQQEQQKKQLDAMRAKDAAKTSK